MTSKIVSEKQLADILNKDRMTMRRWRRKGIITPCYTSGTGGASRFMYRLSEVKRSLMRIGKAVDNIQ